MKTELRFESHDFIIEEAMLFLQRPLSTVERSLAPGVSPSQERTLDDVISNFHEMDVRRGALSLTMERPKFVGGMLFSPLVRWRAGTLLRFAWTEFRQPVTDGMWQSGVITVNMDNYTEVLIKVRDSQGRPLGGGMVGFVSFQREGGFELPIDENAELRLLLPPGGYGARRIGGSLVQFQVTGGEEKQVLTLTAPTQ